MRTRSILLVFTLVVPMLAAAQGPGDGIGPGFRPGGGPPRGAAGGGPLRAPMGKWWQNSALAQRLKLSDQQIKQLNDIFYEHRLKLIDFQAEVEKQDLKLQALLDEDSPNENQVGSQVDQVLGARGKLEREFTMMNLDLRKVLTVDQWKQLKTEQSERRGPGRLGFRGSSGNDRWRPQPPGGGADNEPGAGPPAPPTPPSSSSQP